MMKWALATEKNSSLKVCFSDEIWISSLKILTKPGFFSDEIEILCWKHKNHTFCDDEVGIGDGKEFITKSML